MSVPGPLALVRIDAALVERIRRGEALGAVALGAVATIALGAGAYGVAFGIWRAPLAAGFAAIKLPVLFLGVAACTTLASAALAPVLRAKLTLAQTAVCILASFAVTAALLAATAPVALFVVACAPPADPRILGLASGDPVVRASDAVAQALVLLHTTVIALAGCAGVVRLLGLIERLGDTAVVARRVVVAWLAMQFLVGAELSWTLRPYLGRPQTAITFFSPTAFDGTFFEEIALLGRATFGAAAPAVLAVFALTVLGALRYALWAAPESARVALEAHGLAVDGPPARVLPWSAFAGATARGATVVVTLASDASLRRDTLTVACANAAAARALAVRIDDARTRPQHGPFRTANA